MERRISSRTYILKFISFPQFLRAIEWKRKKKIRINKNHLMFVKNRRRVAEFTYRRHGTNVRPFVIFLLEACINCDFWFYNSTFPRLMFSQAIYFSPLTPNFTYKSEAGCIANGVAYVCIYLFIVWYLVFRIYGFLIKWALIVIFRGCF